MDWRVLGSVLGLGVLAACGGGDRGDAAGSDTTAGTETAAAEPESDNGASSAIADAAASTPEVNWSSAQKMGVGTSYEAYRDGAFSDEAATGPVSRVWFSLTQDRITEVMWGLIHEAQIREIVFEVWDGDTPIEPTRTEVFYAPEAFSPDGLPIAPAYTLTQGGDDWELKVTVWTATDAQVLMMRVQYAGPTDWVIAARIDPAMANTGTDDEIRILDDRIHAFEGNSHLVAQADTGASAAVIDMPVDGDVAGRIILSPAGRADEVYTGTLAVGFGNDFDAASAAAMGALGEDPVVQLEKYVSEWEDYLRTLDQLPSLAEQSLDDGQLAYASAIVLKVMEDKTHAGALIASLSFPWGLTADASVPQTGYKAVWPRDFFQVASAFLAMGDEETAVTAFRYLPRLQVREDTPGNEGVTGWFLQKTHVDGTIEWVAVQQDQTAMPILLGYKLWQAGAISDEEMAGHWEDMLKPAADFLVDGGRPDILWNDAFDARLGLTQQDRWEEQSGWSPSTMAAVISGLVVAGELADAFGDAADADRYRAAADDLEGRLEALTFTTEGELGNGRYFLRISDSDDPNDKTPLGDNNGRAGLPKDQIVDGGFLELVRYGVRSAGDPAILDTLGEFTSEKLDDDIRVVYRFPTAGGVPAPGFRRYGNDGYGEDGERGTNYHERGGQNTAGQRGRVWPFLSGEFAHYSIDAMLAQGQSLDIVRRTGVGALEAFANDGLMLPEQVWDGVGPNPFGYEVGEGTDGATPLAWAHAEYIKLLRSLRDGKVWDRYDVVAERYAPAEE